MQPTPVMPVRLLVISILLLLSSNSALATTIVVARTATEIVIGADSKVTDAYGNDLSKHACKILPVGRLVVAIEGFEIDRQTGFNLPEIATKALQLKPDATASEKVSILTGLLVSRLFEELVDLQRRAPDSYSRKFAGGRAFLRFVVAGFERGRPLVFVRNFRAVQFGPQKIGITVLPDDCRDDCHGNVVTRFLGETEAIDGLPEETPGFWQEGLINGVRRLVETEIAARSEYDGPPIDIVRIDKNGVQWIQKKPECSTPTSPKRSTRPVRAKRPARD